MSAPQLASARQTRRSGVYAGGGAGGVEYMSNIYARWSGTGIGPEVVIATTASRAEGTRSTLLCIGVLQWDCRSKIAEFQRSQQVTSHTCVMPFLASELGPPTV